MVNDQEFEMKIKVDDNLSINCKLQKEMTVEEFEAVIMRAKALSKASGYGNVLGLKKRSYTKRVLKFWEDQEEMDLRKLWGKSTKEELEKKFGRTFIAIFHKGLELGLDREVYKKFSRKNKGNNASWNESDEVNLKNFHKQGMDISQIAAKLHKTVKQCQDKIKNLKTFGRW